MKYFNSYLCFQNILIQKIKNGIKNNIKLLTK